jgi:hypothetical protein
MEKTTVVRTAVAAAVAGVGLAVGGVALATADEQPSQAPSATPDDEGNEERGNGRGPGHHRWLAGGGDFAERLAEELGIDEARVEDALEAIREEARENRPELDEVDPDELREEIRTRLRENLVERLDDAVEEGTLTEQDKASVLKAFDAEVIGALDRVFHRMPGLDGPDEDGDDSDQPGTSES